MKRLIAAGALLTFASPAWADDPAPSCSHPPPTVSPDGSAYTLLYDFFTAMPLTPISCSASVTFADPVPTGTVAVFSADYRGFLSDPDPTKARMRVTQDGRVEDVTVTQDSFVDSDDPDLGGSIFHSGYAGSNGAGTGIDSQVALGFVDWEFSDSEFTVDSIDYNELARANVSDLFDSASDLSAARTGTVTQLNGTMDLLAGAGRPFASGDGIDVVGGVGSVTLGVQGRMTLTEELMVHGGIAFIDQHSANASATGVAGTVALRYAPQTGDGFQPFADVGIKVAPGMGLSLSRSYLTNQGTSTVSGQTTGTFLGAYVSGGVLVAPDPNNDIVFSASFARDSLSTAAYSETLNGSNLFAASAPAQTGVFDTMKAGAAWTTRPLDNVEVTLHGAVGATIAETPVKTNIAFAGGTTSAAVSEAFVEYGVRAGTEFSPGAQAGLFVHATTGAISGTHAQIGGDLRVQF